MQRIRFTDRLALVVTLWPFVMQVTAFADPPNTEPIPLKGVAPPAAVVVSGAPPSTPVTLDSVCLGPFPNFLQGATFFARPQVRNPDVKQGRVELQIRQDTPLLAAVSWEYDGNNSGGWTGERLQGEDLSRAGWVYVGNLQFRDAKIEKHSLYWRMCKTGEQLALRTRKYRAPYVIVPAADAPSPLAEILSDDLPDSVVIPAGSAAAYYLLRSGNFDQLESRIKQFREQKARFRNGASKLNNCYLGLTAFKGDEVEWQEIFKQVQAWIEKNPQSVAAQIALAQCWKNYAWKARGGGYAYKVTPEGWRQFQERILKAQEVLDNAKQLKERDPHLYSVEMNLAVDLGYPRERTDRILQESLKVDPTYTVPIVEMTRYLLPRWHGRPGELEQFALDAVEMTKQHSGHSIYTTIVWEASLYHGADVFEDFKFSWPLVKRGGEDRRKLFPKSTKPIETLCRLACFQGDRETARALFEEFQETSGGVGPDTDIWRRWAQKNFLEGDQVAVYEGCRAEVMALEWMPDGKRWLTFDAREAIVVWDALQGNRLHKFKSPEDMPAAMAITPDGESLVAAHFDQSIMRYDLTTGAEKHLGGHDEAILSAVLSPDGNTFASTGFDKTIKFWDLKTDALADTWENAGTAALEALAYLPDGKTLVVGGRDRRVTFWNIADRHQVGELAQFASGVKKLRISNDGKLLVVLDAKELSLWRLPEKVKLRTLEMPKQTINDLALSPNGTRLAAATGPFKPVEAGQVVVWDTADGKLLHSYNGHKQMVRCLRFSPDGKTILSGSDDMTIRSWKVDRP